MFKSDDEDGFSGLRRWAWIDRSGDPLSRFNTEFVDLKR